MVGLLHLAQAAHVVTVVSYVWWWGMLIGLDLIGLNSYLDWGSL